MNLRLEIVIGFLYISSRSPSDHLKYSNEIKHNNVERRGEERRGEERRGEERRGEELKEHNKDKHASLFCCNMYKKDF
jgi:hypothetical protein